MLMFKTLAAIGLFAAAGAAVGYSKILCAGGECAITGTPYGGAFMGGMIGLAVISGFNNPAKQLPKQDTIEGDSESDHPAK